MGLLRSQRADVNAQEYPPCAAAGTARGKRTSGSCRAGDLDRSRSCFFGLSCRLADEPHVPTDSRARFLVRDQRRFPVCDGG